MTTEHKRGHTFNFRYNFETYLLKHFPAWCISCCLSIVGVEVLVRTTIEALQQESQYGVLHPFALDTTAEHQIEQARLTDIDHSKAYDAILAEAVGCIDHVRLQE